MPIRENVAIKQKSLGLTILLAMILYGLGHFYLGFKMSGVVFFVCGIIFSIIAFTLPPPATLFILFLWWVVQLIDAIKSQKALNAAWQRQYMGYRK